MRYDFSQEHANEMLEKADETNDELTHQIAVLNERIAALEAVAEAARLYRKSVNADAGEFSEAYWVDDEYCIVPETNPSKKWFLTKLDIATCLLDNALDALKAG